MQDTLYWLFSCATQPLVRRYLSLSIFMDWFRVLMCNRLRAFPHKFSVLNENPFQSISSVNMALLKICYHTLYWRHNEGNCVSNHWRLDCLLNRLFRRRSKKTSQLHVTGLCEGNPPVTGGLDSPNKGPVTWKMFPFDDVMMRVYWYMTYISRYFNSLAPDDAIWRHKSWLSLV